MAYNNFTHNFTHTHTHTNTLTYTNFTHTNLTHTHTHNFVTHTTACPSHKFVTYHLSHTLTSHTHKLNTHTHTHTHTHNFVTHISMFTELRLRPVLVSNACFVCRHVYLAASPACFGIKWREVFCMQSLLFAF